MTTDFRALCIELADAYLRTLEHINNSTWLGYEPSDDLLLQRTRAALADEPAVPQGREPAAVTGQPSDEEIMGLMPQQMHEDLAAAVRAMAEQQGIDSTPAKGAMRIILNRHVVDLARAALADEPPEPIPPAALPEGYIDPEHSGDDRALLQTFYSACQAEGGTADEVTLQGLRDVLELWDNPTPPPPADGEVAELVAWLREQLHVCLQAPWTPGIKHFGRAAEPLERLSPPQPVPVSERPWEREGWCDTDGLCWLGSDALDGRTPTWFYGPPAWAERFPNFHRVLLPAHALPLPEVGE